MRPALRLFLGLLCTALPLGAAQAQATGFVHLQTHVTGFAGAFDFGFSRIFEQGANGLVEKFSEQYLPGQHTLARVETIVGTCRAVATNVSFTIVAGQWTDVDVPMQFEDCNVNLHPEPQADGVGTVTYTVLGDNQQSIEVARCTTVFDLHGVVALSDFHGCQGTVPYGALITATRSAGSAKSCCSGSDTLRALMHNDGVVDFTHRSWSFIDTSAGPHPHQTAFDADLSITRTRVYSDSQVMVAEFTIENHGPNDASNVQMYAQPDSITLFNQAAVSHYTVGDGNCFFGTPACFLNWLPAGGSTTFTVRYSGVPASPVDTTNESPSRNPVLADIPTRQPACYQARVIYSGDNNQANNAAACVDPVSVTVTLGGNTPRNQTVAKGSSNVPMLEFELNPVTTETVSQVKVQAQGSGNEQVDVTAVNLWLDKNANGLKDAGDSLVSTGTFAANNGTVVLVVDPGLEISAPTTLLVTYSFSLTIAQRLGATSLLLLGLCFVPVARRRKRLALGVVVLILGIGITSCGGSSPTGPGGGSDHTYQAKLTGLTVSGTDVTAALTGATVTIQQ